MRQPGERPATYEDLVALPENMVGQIIGGELIAHPRPRSSHAYAATYLAGLSRSFGSSGGPGGWWILMEPELALGGDILVPDLAGWRRERMPTMPDVPRFELAPDWVCEILSPSTTRVDRVLKRYAYARERVQFLWYVDPAVKVLEALQLRDGGWSDVGAWDGDARVRAAPFEAVELDLSELWLPEGT